MGIDVAWVNERHEHIQEVFDPHECLTRLATSTWPLTEKSICLRFVDPWGDTVFNQAQIPQLLVELRNERIMQKDAEIRAHLEKVAHLVERAVGETHTYVKFIGD